MLIFYEGFLARGGQCHRKSAAKGNKQNVKHPSGKMQSENGGDPERQRRGDDEISRSGVQDMYPGLANLGNTCFINACIHILVNSLYFGMLLDSLNWKAFDQPCEDYDKGASAAMLFFYNRLRGVMLGYISTNDGHEKSVVMNGKHLVVPETFIRVIRSAAQTKKREIFSGFGQNDMTEFLMFFMDCIHQAFIQVDGLLPEKLEKQFLEELGCLPASPGEVFLKSNTELDAIYRQSMQTYIDQLRGRGEYSVVNDLFHGIIYTRIIPMPTESVRSAAAAKDDDQAFPETAAQIEKKVGRPELFFLSNFVIPGSPATSMGRPLSPLMRFSSSSSPMRDAYTVPLESLFEKMLVPELLSGSSAWFNETTGKTQDAWRTTSYWKMPVHWGMTFSRLEKGSEATVVTFPLSFSMLPLVNASLSADTPPPPPPSSSPSERTLEYELYGVVNYMGNQMSGHYTCFVRNETTREWMYCDDTDVEILGITESGAKSSFLAETRKRISEEDLCRRIYQPCVYCVFYQKK